MNDHLESVFLNILPEIEKNKIDYWVFGGISIAAYAGNFIRKNQDVDTFIRDTDFENTKILLKELCVKNGFKLELLEGDERPKIEIKVNNKERFSVIPIYQKDDVVILKYKDGDQEYPNKILEKVERNIAGFRFFTTQNKYIKEMFIKHIKVRPDKKILQKIIDDANAILNSEELFNYGFPIN